MSENIRQILIDFLDSIKESIEKGELDLIEDDRLSSEIVDIFLNSDDYSEQSVSKKIPFDVFWNLYDKKCGDKRKLVKKWDKYSMKTQVQIIDYIEIYKKAQPNKKYRKHPGTFFNNESWKDEIINNSEKEKEEPKEFDRDEYLRSKGIPC